VHRLCTKQGEELLILEEPAQRIDDKGQPSLRYVGFPDQELLALRLVLITLDQRRRGNLAGMRRAAASVGLLAALTALQNDSPNCQDLVAGQEFVLIGLGERPLDIAVSVSTPGGSPVSPSFVRAIAASG